jgi:hypothetical protein
MVRGDVRGRFVSDFLGTSPDHCCHTPDHYRRYSLITLWMIFTITFIFAYCFYLNFSSLPRLFNFPFNFAAFVVVVLNLVVIFNLSILCRGPKAVIQVSLLLTPMLLGAVWILLVMLTIICRGGSEEAFD